MKRILSMLLAIVMVVSMIPVAASAADVASGLASASRDSKWTYSYTAPADGTLTITVGDGETAWASDVMNLSNFSNSEDVTGTEQASYTYDVVGGTKYSIRIFGQGDTSAAISDVPYSIVFTPASGEEEDTTITVKGEIANDDSGVAMTGTDAAVSAGANVQHSFTPKADGILTVHIKSASTNWKVSGEGISPQEGKGEAAVEYEVSAGETYVITLGCYADWDWATGTITYDILFYETELTVKQEEYTIVDTVITTEGEHKISMVENAKITVVTFTPSETGIYKITAPEGATVANCGGGSWLINTGAEFANSVEWTCQEVAGEYENDGETYVAEGQSLMVGIKSDAASVTLTIEKTGDYVAEEIPLIPYENEHTPESFILPEGSILGSYVNVSDTVEHTAVLGEDGYYHLDSEDGDILLIDMNYQEIVLTDKLNSDIPTMYAYVTQDDGTKVKYDIANAVRAYEAACDENGYYPLTSDLIFFYERYATDQGTWINQGLEAINESNADAWLYCCRTVVLPTTSGSFTVEAEGEATWTAPLDGVVKFTAAPAETEIWVMPTSADEPICTITNGSGEATVTAGTAYSFFEMNAVAATVEWEYVNDSEDDEGDDETTKVLTLGDNALELAEGNRNGGTWTYTATEDGTLTATVSYLKYYVQAYEEEGEYDAYEAMTDADLQGACGRLMQFIVNGNNAYTNTQSIEVKTGDEVTVQLISNYYYRTEATLNLSMGEDSGEEGGEIVQGDGTQGNPYIISSLPYTVSVQGNHDVYYRYTAANNGTMKITYMLANYVSALPSNYEKDSTNRWYTVEVTAGQVINMNLWGTTTGDYVISIVEDEAPDGGETTDALVLGDNAVSVPAGLSGGSWTYTATEAGTLSASVTALTLVEPDYENEGQYIDSVVPEAQVTMVVGMQMSFLINGVDALNNTVQVNAGDEVTVQLSHRMGTEFRATINLSLGQGSGGEDVEDPNPDLYDGSGTEVDPYVIPSLPVTLTVVADTYFKYVAAEEGTIVLTDSTLDEGCLVAVNGGDVQNDTTYAVAAGDTLIINPYNSGTITVSYSEGGDVDPSEPDGTYAKPYILDTLYTTINPELVAWTTVFYQYQATEAGVVMVEDSDAAIYTEYHVNGDYVEAPVSFSAGDVIKIGVYAEESGSYSLTLVDPSVAKVGGIGYVSVEEALAAAKPGEVVTLVTDAVVDGGVTLPVGVNLNLGAYSLTADYLVGFKGSYIIGNPPTNKDDLSTGGTLFVDKNALILSTVGTIDGTDVLPVWDDTASTPCYRFSKVALDTTNGNNGLKVTHGESIYFQFQQQFTGAIRNSILVDDGFSDNELSVAILLEWNVYDDEGNLQGTANQEFVYSDYFTQYVSVANTRFYTFTMTGYSTLSIDTFTITPVIKSNSGAVVYGESFTYGAETGTTGTESNDGDI